MNKKYTAQEMREMEAIVASGDIGQMTRETVAKMLKQAAEMIERLDEANRKVYALMNNHVTFSVDCKEYYQPFLSRDVKEISSILRGDTGKE